MLLVGCGAAAGIAGIFKAPIAGVLFTIEVLLIDLNSRSVVPLIIASVTGATVAYAFTGYNVEFFFSQSEQFFTSRIPFVILLGLFCGFVSLYFNKTIEMMENMFSRITKPGIRFAIGAVILSSLIFFFPDGRARAAGRAERPLPQSSAAGKRKSLSLRRRPNPHRSRHRSRHRNLRRGRA